MFLHGGALTAHTWDLCCLALRDDFHCLALDQRGHGDTDWAPDGDYSIARAGRRRQGLRRPSRARQVRAGRHVDGRDQRAGLSRSTIPTGSAIWSSSTPARRCGAPDRAASATLSTMSPTPSSVEAIIERALKFNPRRDPKILRRSLMHDLRQQPDGSWHWKYDRSRFQRLDQETHRAERAELADGLAASPARPWSCAAARATYSTRRTASAWPSACPKASSSTSPRRPHRAGRQPEGPRRRTAPVSGKDN